MGWVLWSFLFKNDFKFQKIIEKRINLKNFIENRELNQIFSMKNCLKEIFSCLNFEVKKLWNFELK